MTATKPAKKKATEIIADVAFMLKDEERWYSDGDMRACNADGDPVDPCSDHAVRWSLKGAVERATTGMEGAWFMCETFVVTSVHRLSAQSSLDRFNFEADHKDVLWVLRDAYLSARAKEHISNAN